MLHLRERSKRSTIIQEKVSRTKSIAIGVAAIVCAGLAQLSAPDHAVARATRGGAIDTSATDTGAKSAAGSTSPSGVTVRSPSGANAPPPVAGESGSTRTSGSSAATVPSGASGPLTVHPTNPRYFADGTGKAIYLTGSHTWSNLQDEWTNSYDVTFDYEAYLDLLQADDHNFIRLWRLELPKYMYEGDGEFRFSEPHPWLRVGAGSVNGGTVGGGTGETGGSDEGDTAIDQGGVTSPPVSTRGPITVGNGSAGGTGGGGMALAIAPTPGEGKFDLTQFNQAFFDRLRERVQLASERGIYVSVMLFEGHGLAHTQEGWSSHPFNASNNVNGINGDVNGDGLGTETHTLENPAVLAIQEAYVKQVIETVNDLDNVLFEIANESTGDSVEWQNHMIELVQSHELTLPKQHPVLFTTPLASAIASDAIWDSAAQAVSPIANSLNGSYADDPPAADGTKVVISDSDHIFGCGGSADWVWKSFARGLNVIYMDSYYEDTPFCPPPSEDIRANMGYTNDYAQRMDLSQTLPLGELSSTGFALVDEGDSYLVYLPEGGSATVDLSAAGGSLPVEWFNIATGEAVAAQSTSGGSDQTFSAPFTGPAVLFIGGSAETPDPGDEGGVVTPVPKAKLPGIGGGGVGGGVLTGDLDGNNLVNIDDAKILVEQWGDCPTSGECSGDLDQDNKVDLSDLIKMLSQWTG